MAIPSVHAICPTLVHCPIERVRLVLQAEFIATGKVEIVGVGLKRLILESK